MTNIHTLPLFMFLRYEYVDVSKQNCIFVNVFIQKYLPQFIICITKVVGSDTSSEECNPIQKQKQTSRNIALIIQKMSNSLRRRKGDKANTNIPFATAQHAWQSNTLCALCSSKLMVCGCSSMIGSTRLQGMTASKQRTIRSKAALHLYIIHKLLFCIQIVSYSE